MLKRVKANYIKTGKIAVGSALSIMIADILGLSFGTAAGIITLLSVQNTKKETLQVAGRRILAFIIAIILSWVVFSMLG
ncbi:MAG: aromatic acid exporter family protein, partial [Clostridium sp.]|nr:aromatic acid exporter family protein [Clostridium sp.]